MVIVSPLMQGFFNGLLYGRANLLSCNLNYNDHNIKFIIFKIKVKYDVDLYNTTD